MPQLSVIIPVYNGAAFVAQTIDSVLRQTYLDREIIVVDDGSTDETRVVLEPYRRKRNIRYLYQDNGGPAKARNTGILAAKGKYIAFLDADDLWLPEKLAFQMDLIKRDGKLKVVHTGVEIIGREGKPLRNCLYDSPVREGWVFEDILLTRCWIFLSSLLAEASVLERVGLFNEALPTAEDTNLFLRIAREYRIGYVGQVLLQRRLHGGNMTEARTMPAGTFKNLDDIAARFPDVRRSALMRLAYERRYRLLGCTLFRGGSYAASRKCFLNALRWRPFNPAAVAYYAATFVPGSILYSMRKLKRQVSGMRSRGRGAA